MLYYKPTALPLPLILKMVKFLPIYFTYYLIQDPLSIDKT